MSRPLLGLASLLFLGASVLPVGAQLCPNGSDTFWQNDLLPQNPTGALNITVIQGLCEGEAAGSIFTMAPGSLPLKLTQVSVGFGHVLGGTGFTATANLEVYEGPVTFAGSSATLGTKIFDLSDFGASVQLSSTALNALDVSSYNITVSDDFVVAFRMNFNPNGSCAGGYNANFFTDYSGGAGCTSIVGVNLLDEASAGWVDPATWEPVPGFITLCPDYYNGNWAIRVCTEGTGTAASATIRNGSGVNPATFVSLTNPVIGTSWITSIDIVTPGAVASAVGIVSTGPWQVPTALGEVLIDISGPFEGGTPNISTGAHSIPVPNDSSLIGVPLWTQGLTIAPGPVMQLTNALDIVCGL